MWQGSSCQQKIPMQHPHAENSNVQKITMAKALIDEGAATQRMTDKSLIDEAIKLLSGNNKDASYCGFSDSDC